MRPPALPAVVEAIHTTAPERAPQRTSLRSIGWPSGRWWSASGWTDSAYELADLVEHPQSRATPDRVWTSFVDRFDLDTHARRRHLAARRMLALFWLARLQPGDGPYTAQADRVRHQLEAHDQAGDP